MKRHILLAGTFGLAACSSSEHSGSSAPPAASTPPPAASTAPQAGFRPSATVFRGWGDAGPYWPTDLPVPVRRPGGLRLATFQLYRPMAKARQPPAEAKREADEIRAPRNVCYGDPATGQLEVRVRIDWEDDSEHSARAHFGFSPPADGLIGHYSDPRRHPEARETLLRQRIYAGLDVLLPLFADPSRGWTPEAGKAAQEVRDFFPLAAEPGLWPYYKAEGREFFAWLDSHAPPEKAVLPWEQEKR